MNNNTLKKPLLMKRKLKFLFAFLFSLGMLNFYSQNAPDANVDYNSTLLGTTLNVSAPGILSNDNDADGDPIVVDHFVISGTNYPAGTTATIAGQGDITINADGSYIFVPVAGYNGDVTDVEYYIQDDETPPRTDHATLNLYVEDSNDNLSISISSCNQGFIQPGTANPAGGTFADGAYKIRYTVTFNNNSQAGGYNPVSQISNIQVFNDLELYFGDSTIFYIDIESVSTSNTPDQQGGNYPQDWDMSDIDTNEFHHSDATPGADGIFLSSSVSNNVLYPRQSVTVNYCLYVDPNYGGHAGPPAVIARSYPDPSGSGIEFDNTVSATSSDGSPTDNVLITDFHTTDSFISAALNLEGNVSTYTVPVNVDGTYDFTNTVIITNDGPTAANDVNYNYALGNWIDDGITFGTLTLTQVSGPSVTLNAGFDGDGSSYLLASGQTLASGQSVVIEIFHHVLPTTYQSTNYFSVTNPSMTLGNLDGNDESSAANKRLISYVTWSDAMGQHVDRYDRTDSLPYTPSSDDQCQCDGAGMRFPHQISTSLDKSVVSNNPAASGTPGNRDITFRLKASVDASSTVWLEQVKLTDNLNSICSGNIVNVGIPTISASTAATNPTINASFDGITDTNIFVGNDGIIEPGQYVWVDFTVEISDTCQGSNTAFLDGKDPEGHEGSSHPNIASSSSVAISVLTPIQAMDDNGITVNNSLGGTTVANVLNDNGNGPDTLDNVPAQLADVNISQVGTWPSGITLDPATGAVDVAVGTPAGVYSLEYQICQTSNPTNCTTAFVNFEVISTSINAEDDNLSSNPVNGFTGGVAGNIFTDNGNGPDDVNGVSATDAIVEDPTVVNDGGLTGVSISPDGSVNVPANAAAGTYTVEYQICATEAPAVCDNAFVTIVVAEPVCSDFTSGTDICTYLTANPTSTLGALDCDGDGVDNSTECGDGTDLMDPCDYNAANAVATNNTAGMDCDNDGVDDATELANGTDPHDPCDYNVADQSTPNTNTAGMDCDGDGVLDTTELTAGTDPFDPCDYNVADITMPNIAGMDCDGDGVLDVTELANGTDPHDPCDYNVADVTLPNTAGLDCDNDGVLDVTELANGTDPHDPCDYNVADVTLPNTAGMDCDGDGVLDVTELANGTDPHDPCDYNVADVTEAVTSGADCDGDGVLDVDELADGTDPTDNCDYDQSSQTVAPDGVWEVADCDGDGVINGTEVTDGTNPQDPCDFDSTHVTIMPDAAWLAGDCDNDGIDNGTEAGTDPLNPRDTDGDNVPDYFDEDSDNDGIPDETEGEVDTDGDGHPDYLDIDDDNDGILTSNEFVGDTDGDNLPDYLDQDSDDDGIPDNVEGQSTDNYVSPTGLDTDGDGLDDAYDNVNSTGINAVDTDNDGEADYVDEDSDGDGIEDSTEAWDTDHDGSADTLPSGNDANNNGIDDAFEEGAVGYEDPNGSLNVGASGTNNTDGDVEPDFRDTDDDNDGESTGDNDDTEDCDNDGIPNYLDPDMCDLIPEGFSPNGDGENDTLIIPTVANVPNFSIEIYDRWGNIVYDYKNEGRTGSAIKWWDGYSEGRMTLSKDKKLVPVGTYFYIIHFNDSDRTEPIQGWIYVNY
jgi:gliding motility-associated-like protein